MSPPPVKAQHFIIVPMSAFGHVRPKLNLACNLLRLSPTIHITFLVLAFYLPKLVPEIARHELSEEQLARLDCVGLGDADVSNHDFRDNEKAEGIVAAGFGDVYAKLLQGLPCGNPDKNYPSPTGIITDIFSIWGPSVKKTVESAVGLERKVPHIGFCAVPAAYLIHWLDRFDPTSTSSAARMLQNELKLQETDAEPIPGPAALFRTNSIEPELCNVPGLPPTYFHELATQELATRWPASVLQIGAILTESFKDYDAYSQPWDANLEPEVISWFKSYPYREGGMPFFPLGPQLPPVLWEQAITEQPLAVKQTAREYSVENKPHSTIDFLNRMYDQFGRDSCLLISFGTLNMPVITSQYIALFETLFSLPKTFPFIFCRDPKMLDLPKSLVELIESHQDTALMVEWSPQQTVLSHPALGWFLSHCGSNSASEAIVEGVGIIGWPIAIDQPAVAAQISARHRIAYELCQVRQGFSIGRPTARGILIQGTDQAIRDEFREIFDLARGEDGRKMLERVREMKRVLLKSWKSGLARKAMEGVVEMGSRTG